VLQGHSSDVNALAVSVDGRMLFSGSLDGTIKQWDVAGNGSCLRTLQAPDWVLSLALSPDGRHLFSGGCGHGDIKHWLFLHAHIVAEATGSTLFPAIADLILQYAEDG
jgi:WD40 repeat protein